MKQAVTKGILLIIATWFLPLQFLAQVTIKVVALPANTPANSTIYLASSLNTWNPADNNYKLTADGNGTPQIVIPEGTGTVQFKFTRGTGWTTVEGGASGEEIGNRSFTFTGSPQTLSLTILSWKDLAGTSGSTAASNVRVLSNSFNMPQLNRSRRIWLYLPPDYQSTTKRYPVLYMHDGQNLFDAQTSFSGEWGVDETLNNLFNSGDYGAIVVGIDNGGGTRLDEYSPWLNPSYGGGEGAAYIDFIAQTLKPYIDANYRTLTDPENTCLFGSSMGALISTYGAVTYPNVFGKVGSFSPAYWFVLTNLTSYISNTPNGLSGLKVFHLGGQNESATMVTHINSITNGLISKGLLSARSKIQVDADGAHSEWYWKREFGAAYKWLFPNTTTSVREITPASIRYVVMPNPVQQYLQLKGYDAKPGDVLRIINIHGQVLKTFRTATGKSYAVQDLRPGVYLLQLNGKTTTRFVKQ